MWPLKFAVIMALVCFPSTWCNKILGIYPMPSHSHQIVFNAINTELLRRNHSLTILTTDPIVSNEFSKERFKQIDTHDAAYSSLKLLWSSVFENHGTSSKSGYSIMKAAGRNLSDVVLSAPQFQNLLKNSKELSKFDLTLVESTIRPLYSLAWRIKKPVIGISTMPGLLSNMASVGNPVHPAFYLDAISVKVDKITVLDRAIALLIHLQTLYDDYTTDDVEHALAKKHFGENVPPLPLVESAMDMLFINVYKLFDGIRPTVPNTIYLGGLHLKPKRKLPEELQNFLNESIEGVVYMSLGSNVKSKDLPPNTVRTILEVFRELPYKVLWKYEEHLPNVPSNVRTSKWLPQQDLLGHPNIKAYIMQGGQQSTEEAIRDQVPLIAIPFVGDQHINVQKICKLGIGMSLDIKTLTTEKLKNAIVTVTTDKKYKENMVRLNRLLSDEPISAMDRAMWWTEYVLRHSGASHLRSPAAKISYVEYFMLDVVAATIIIIIITLFCIAISVKSILNQCKTIILRRRT